MSYCKNFRITLAQLRELQVNYYIHNRIVRALEGKKMTERDEDAERYFRSSHCDPVDLEFILNSNGIIDVATIAEYLPEECYQDLRMFSIWHIRQYAHLVPDWRVQQGLDVIEDCIRKNNFQRKFANAMELLLSQTSALVNDSEHARGKYQRKACSMAEAAMGINRICRDLLDEPGEAMFSAVWVSVDNFIYAEQYLKTGGIGDDQKRYEAAMAIDAKLKEMFLLMLYDKAPWQIGSEK